MIWRFYSRSSKRKTGWRPGARRRHDFRGLEGQRPDLLYGLCVMADRGWRHDKERSVVGRKVGSDCGWWVIVTWRRGRRISRRHVRVTAHFGFRGTLGSAP